MPFAQKRQSFSLPITRGEGVGYPQSGGMEEILNPRANCTRRTVKGQS
jgi:hypothetical protein